jgi:dTDP-4-amino-4,6-dideoxygalactose transaminase
MVLTNSQSIAERVEIQRSHGVTRDASKMLSESEGDWYYEQQALGYNYRMTEIQGALGLSQLSRLDEFVRRRHAVANVYLQELATLPVEFPSISDGVYSSYHLFVIMLNLEVSTRSRREVFDALRLAGVGVNVHYIPVHLQPYYRQFGFGPGDYPAAERYYERAISLPLYPTLEKHEQELVIRELIEILK